MEHAPPNLRTGVSSSVDFAAAGPDPARLLECVVDAILVIDESGAIVYANAAAAALSGRTDRGASALDLVHPDDQDRITEAFGSLVCKLGASTVASLRVAVRDTWMPVEVNAVNLVGDPAIGGIVACFRNLTTETTTPRVADRLRAAL